jgi:signal transduction histidine kinase
LPAAFYFDVDRVQFERMISSLVSNGVRYTRPGGDVRIRLEQCEEPEEVHILIADTGVGIPAGHQAKIFDRLYKVREGQYDDGGLGLGLSLADWAARAHGGRIEVYSEPGIGSHFTVVLPGRGEPASEAERTDAAGRR